VGFQGKILFSYWLDQEKAVRVPTSCGLPRLETVFLLAGPSKSGQSTSEGCQGENLFSYWLDKAKAELTKSRCGDIFLTVSLYGSPPL